MKLKHLLGGFALAVLTGSFDLAMADVRLPALFTDHAVFQQGEPIHIWGWANPGESITITFRKQKTTVKTPASGKWTASIKSEKAGGPDTLTVKGNNTLTVQDVLVGEVWIASGQSNMEMADE